MIKRPELIGFKNGKAPSGALLILSVTLMIGAVVALLRPRIVFTLFALTLAACMSCASAALRNGLRIGGVAMNILRWGW